MIIRLDKNYSISVSLINKTNIIVNDSGQLAIENILEASTQKQQVE